MKPLSLVVVVCGVLACSSTTAPNVHLNGTVLFNPIEGGFYEIRGEDGVNYDPTNLPGCYKEDGLRVETTFKILEGAGSVHMIGPVVEIQSITSPARICALPGA